MASHDTSPTESDPQNSQLEPPAAARPLPPDAPKPSAETTADTTAAHPANPAEGEEARAASAATEPAAVAQPEVGEEPSETVEPAASEDSNKATEAATTAETSTAAETDSVAATDATAEPQRGFRALDGLHKAFIVLLVIIAGLSGYIVRDKMPSATDPASNSQAAEQPEAQQAQQPHGVAALSEKEIARLASMVKPGTQPLTPQSASGRFDAHIHGPGGTIQSQADILNVARRNPADPFAQGAADAPVVISEFSDFECPFCAHFTHDTEPDIIAEYVQKGLVRIEWNDLPINGPEAELAAQAGRAAAAQGRFPQFRDALYGEAVKVKGHPHFGREDFIRFARQAGVTDIAAFTHDLDAKTYAGDVSQALSYGTSIGVQGTPGFLIGQTYISGAQPIDIFRKAITLELAKVAAGEVHPTDVHR